MCLIHFKNGTTLDVIVGNRITVRSICTSASIFFFLLPKVMSHTDSRVISQACEGSPDVPLELFDLPYIRARITNFEPLTPLKNLKANFFGKDFIVKF